ncbi:MULTISPECIES: UDP-galactopyranose mutase [Geobacillus]|uniref:UDP-galactopyranose mutase n=1 Tax=Geobacillus thermoleovorans TaxID=33941 RepID=A0A2Z3N780_GEOTH|nr:UDP-galactopyranose mutase [Geobacillus thermoleovorans]AKM20399.1 UDP-galactopyranose mutase [Geobacillus sp. 12AMOR1]AWO74736.1 UDP-galactopyranose mutase [Geobacillus thermoleovorans]MBW7642884.1 UDP-galactopyranose mutase [Geobacillus thermoleovorans]WJQ10300.1 UDP-galactopyranose mutase [Geobacillus stearothermophilus]
MFDYVVVGAGFAGAVIAERIATQLNEKVLVIEKRNHIGGNAYDYYDENGILVHKYGPHIFHTRSREVWDYLSQFTDWHLYHHHVLGSIDGKKVPIPFNLNTLHELLPESFARPLEEKLVSKFGYNVKVPILKLRETDDKDLKFLADFVYEKVFLNYTTKQWGMKPEELDPTVTGRVPVYISRDNRYFQDAYQGMPKEGYTKIFEKLLSHSNIKLMLNTDYKEVIDIDVKNGKISLFGQEFKGILVYTGKIDEFFNYEFGELPYRSLRFEFENIQKEFVQPVGTINYPNEYQFTRITEFKHLTGQEHSSTTIVKEYPQGYERNVKGKDIPYYPIPKKENLELYAKYKEWARQFPHVFFVGRLAEYRYYDMDAVIARALTVFKNYILR